MKGVITIHKTISQIIDEEAAGVERPAPINISVIPNYMGINLCSVDSLTWQEQADGQMVNLTINFIPEI